MTEPHGVLAMSNFYRQTQPLSLCLVAMCCSWYGANLPRIVPHTMRLRSKEYF